MNTMKETIIRSRTEAFCWSEGKEVINPHSNGVPVDMLRLAKVPPYVADRRIKLASDITKRPLPQAFVSSHLLENKKLPQPCFPQCFMAAGHTSLPFSAIFEQSQLAIFHFSSSLLPTTFYTQGSDPRD